MHEATKLTRNSKYFPPTADDVSSEDKDTKAGAETEASESLATALPDPPTMEPKDPDEPDTKKPKVDSEPIEEGWEEVDKSTDTGENGPTEEKASLQTDDRTQKVEAAVMQGVVSGKAEAPQSKNMLGKDW